MSASESPSSHRSRCNGALRSTRAARRSHARACARRSSQGSNTAAPSGPGDSARGAGKGRAPTGQQPPTRSCGRLMAQLQQQQRQGESDGRTPVAAAPDDRPDVQIFMALLSSNLWRPADSGRKVALDWLQHLARAALAGDDQAGVQERRDAFREALQAEDLACELHPCRVLPQGHKRSPYTFRMWPDKVQALVTYDTMRLHDPGLPWTVRNGRYLPAGLHTPRLTVVAVKDMGERGRPGTYAYFFAEPEQAGPVFFEGLPPAGFAGARQKSQFSAACSERMAQQLRALADIFSDHERFIRGELQPFFETSGSLQQAPAWGIIDAAFLRHLTAHIQRWPTLDDCRRAVKEEQQRLCDYIESIRFRLRPGLADKLEPLGPLPPPNGSAV